MGFSIAGSLSGNGPVIVNMHVSETCYVGQLVMTPTIGGLGGNCQILDAANEAHENDLWVMGLVVGSGGRLGGGSSGSERTFNSTYKGDTIIYTTTQATIAANGEPGTARVAIITPDTLLRGPIFNGAFGTALTELDITTADSAGTSVTHAGDTITDIADDLGTVYCRSGANKGLYRIVTTGTTTAQTVTIPFPYTIAANDVFVMASVVKTGLGGIQIPATADCIDGNAALSSYFDVFVHELNLEETGKEFAIFRFMPSALAAAGA